MPLAFKIGAIACGAFLFGFCLIYAIWRPCIRGGAPKWDWKTMLLYMGVALPVCVMVEVLCGKLHLALFETKLWRYQVLPAHDGMTSLLNFAIWPLYGWHTFLYEQASRTWRLSPLVRNAIWTAKLALSGVVLECLANLGSLALFDRHYFYYFPGDLAHLSSFQVVPYYFLGSLGLCLLLNVLRDVRPKLAVALLCYALGCAFLVW